MKRSTLSSAAASTAGRMGDAAGANAGQVTFFADSRVASERITLDDVARIEGVSDAELKTRLRQIDLGNSPRPMSSRTLSRSTVEAALRQAGVKDKLKIHFPKKMTVHRTGQKLAADDVARRAHEAISQEAAEAWGEGHQVAVEPIKWRSEMILPAGEVVVDARTRDGQPPLGASMITVRFVVDGVEAEERTVSARVSVTGPLCQAAGELARDQRIEQGDLMEVQGPLERGALSCKDALGQAPRSRIKPGAVIKARMVKPPMLVRRGDRVTIVYQNGGLRITARGEAMRDGTRGQWIPVTNSASQQVIKALVQAPGQVQVQ